MYFKPFSGLGDKLLDLIGFLVYCNHAKHCPIVDWCSDLTEKHPWGSGVFDASLFNFGDLKLESVNETETNIVISKSTGASLSITNVQDLLEKENQITISCEDLVKDYISTARRYIKPSALITLPKNIELCLGIHLRRTDKIKQIGEGDPRHETDITEYNDIIHQLKNHLELHVKYNNDTDFYFCVCSEDEAYKTEFTNWLRSLCQMYDKKCNIIVPKYLTAIKGHAAVTDMFCLSKCRSIYQGIKYSTFSTIAAIIGGVNLYNFGFHPHNSLIHLWKPCVTLINPPSLGFCHYKIDKQTMQVICSKMNLPITPFTKVVVYRNAFWWQPYMLKR